MRSHALRHARVCVLAIGFLSLAASAAGEIGDFVADGLVGRATFTDASAHGIGASSIGRPAGIAVDRTRDRIYIADSSNHRVLGWSNASALADGAPADLVIGQPDFLSWGCNRAMDGGTRPLTMESLCDPEGIAVDVDGNLYVADTGNCRVLMFDDPYATDTVADRLLGQADGHCDGTTMTASKLFLPKAVAVDGARNVYVADGACRVVEFDGPLASNDAVADRVYGQEDFVSDACSAYTLYFPQSLALDPAGRLWVGSYAYVYAFDSPLAGDPAHPQPTRILGSGSCNPNGETSSSTCFPSGVAADSAGRVYVADAVNSRVLGFDSPMTVSQAAVVFGQPSFGAPLGGTTFCGNQACNNGGPSASSLCLHNFSGSIVSCSIDWLAAVAVDAADNLWVADGYNNRVLRYDQPRTSDRIADLVLGQATMSDVASPVVPLASPAVSVSTWNSLALAVDTDNSRLLVYPNLTKYGEGKPVAIIGQPDLGSTGCNSGGASARSLCRPAAALAGTNGELWIADTGNNRVLRFDRPWFEYDFATKQYVLKRDADAVFGQTDFSSIACGVGATRLCLPQGLAQDARGNLYVSDSGNNRVLIDQNPQSSDRAFERVLGQPDFTQKACSPGTGGVGAICDPRGIDVLSHVDGWGIDQGDDLYIAEHGNNRVLLYKSVEAKAAGAGADAVFGQAGDMNTGACRRGADGLCGPSDVAMDRGGNLLVADTLNNRVLVYDDPLSDTAADRVFGQSNLDAFACNEGKGPSDTSLCAPVAVATAGAYEGNVLVGDAGNDRIVRYQAPYCVESFSLTSANRRLKGIRSKPVRARVAIARGTGPSDDTVEIRDRLVLLEDDGGIYPNDPPLFTLAQDSAFSNVLFKESVPPWISNVRATANGGVWSTDDLELPYGITRYDINEQFYIPSGFSDAPQRDNLTYKALAVGEDVPPLAGSGAWLRAQFGSTCFTTELSCRSGATNVCTPAPAAR